MLAMLVTGSTINLMSMIGVIMLMGDRRRDHVDRAHAARDPDVLRHHRALAPNWHRPSASR